MDPRFIQANREARWTLVLTFAYLFCWAASAYYLGNKPGILGFPFWFEISCIFVPVTFILLCGLMVHKKFRNIPLDD